MEHIVRKFEAMGARVKFRELIFPRRQPLQEAGKVEVDVSRDARGEYFDVAARGRVDLEVIQVRPEDRHLLLMARIPEVNGGGRFRNIKMLCGHDEREWFAAQVPSDAVNVTRAKEALKPEPAAMSQARKKVKEKDKNRRRNRGFVRQGEWFFIPDEEVRADPLLILRKEPIMVGGARGGRKAHMADEAFRRGGETVHVHPQYARAGMTANRKAQLCKRNEDAAKSKLWRIMVRNPELYVRGAVRHPDHKTIHLRGWHRVLLNREVRGQNSAVAFLD